jgi:hypothetical protein
MLKLNRLLLAAVTALSTMMLVPIDARAFDLSGAWASQAELCEKVFAKKGTEIVFAELSELYGSGFIADGDHLKGKTAQCTIRSRKQDGDRVELNAACATSIMTQDVTFDLTFQDADNLTRAFPEVPGMTLRYSRCKL